LWNAGIDTQWIDAGDVKQLAARRLSAGVDQRARIDVALVSTPVKGA